MIIRPYYRSGEFYGFVILAFNEHERCYEPVGAPYRLYKFAQLALRSIVAERQLELHYNNKVA